ncbi:MAG: hypothetical protein QMC81_08490 [Thermoanaerobacterales bacterium]|nr:hypothetical protein [Bacillota bacterium]MDI6907508.1 hypothetical protein [Thermoanaerobacterales bacterium]
MDTVRLAGLVSIIGGFIWLVFGIQGYKEKGLTYGLLEVLYFSLLGLFEMSSVSGLIAGPILIVLGICLLVF